MKFLTQNILQCNRMQFDMLTVKREYSHIPNTHHCNHDQVGAPPCESGCRNLCVGDLLREGPEKRWILFVAMWRGCKLSSSGSRFLGGLRSVYRGTRADCPRLTTSAGECVWRSRSSSPPCRRAVLRRRGAGADRWLLLASARGELKTRWSRAFNTPLDFYSPFRRGQVPLGSGQGERSQPDRSQVSRDLCLIFFELLPQEQATRVPAAVSRSCAFFFCRCLPEMTPAVSQLSIALYLFCLYISSFFYRRNLRQLYCFLIS